MNKPKLVEILKQLSEEPRTNHKIKILRNCGNPDMKRFLNYVYNPFIIYGIKSTSIPNIVYGLNDEIPLDMFEELQNISGRNNKIKCVEKYLSECTKDVIYWTKLAIDKDLNINIAKKIINKAYNTEVVPDFKLMLAWKVDDKRYERNFSDLDWLYYNVKIDGIRCVCNIDYNGKITFITRNGLPIEDFLTKNIRTDIEKNIDLYKGMTLDGEIYSKYFQKLMRIVSRKNVNLDSVYIRESTRYKIFDIISDSELNLIDRVKRMKELEEKSDFNYISFIKYFRVKQDFTLIQNISKIYIDKGAEGIIIKHPFKKYETKRSNYWLKFKNVDTIDLKCIGYYQGKQDTAFENILGGIILDYNGIELRCGSGFTEEERKLFWENREELTGQIVEISYMEITKTGSLRHPVFERFRKDK